MEGRVKESAVKGRRKLTRRAKIEGREVDVGEKYRKTELGKSRRERGSRGKSKGDKGEGQEERKKGRKRVE